MQKKVSRLALPLAGSTLAAYGLAKRSKLGVALALGGGFLIYEGVRGEARPSAARKFLTAGLTVQRTIAIDAPPEYLYNFWKDFERLPSFMQHLEKVEMLEGSRSRWTASGPLGSSFSWNARVIADEANRKISWESDEDSPIINHGSVTFSPATGNRGTFMHVSLFYKPPAGKLGAMFASLFGEEPEQQVREDLRRFKQVVEAGEIPTTYGQPSGRRSIAISALKALHGEGHQKRGKRRSA